MTQHTDGLDLLAIRKWVVDSQNGYLAPAEEVFIVLCRLVDLYEAEVQRRKAAEAVAQWTVSEANSLGGLPMGLGKLGEDIAAWQRIVEESHRQ